MSLKKRNGKWSMARLTTVAVFATSMIVAGQKTWPYVVQGVRPWAETPDKVEKISNNVDVLTKKVDMIANRLGMDTDPKPMANPYLPPRMQSEWAPTNRPTVAQVTESTNRTKL